MWVCGRELMRALRAKLKGRGSRAAATGAWAVFAALAGAGAAQPVGTAFSYQGRLNDSGSPANGSFDFQFTLYDAPATGAVVAGPVSASGIVVTQGLFTTLLDFGSAAFAGQARWLQIDVRPAGGGGFTSLAPRQQLTPSPYSVFSSYTDPLNLTSLNASNLSSGNLPSARLSGTYSQALSLSNPANAVSGTFTGSGLALTNLNAGNLASGTVPSGVVAGLYANALSLPNPANIFVGDGAGLTNLNAQPRYARTVVVSPVGTSTQNGSALLAALAGITTASAGNPFLLKVEPGTYYLGTTSFVMKPFVDVEGSGEGVTKITGLGSASNFVGTVQAVTNTELRFLTIENTGGAAYAKPLFVDAAAPRITHVTVIGFGATAESQGFYAQNGATPTVHALTARASATGGASSFGVLNVGAGSVFSDLNAFAMGGTFARAVANYVAATPTMRGVVAIASGATTENQGIASFDSSPTLENVVGIATGAATNNLGCIHFGNATAASLRLALCRGVGATGINYGILNNGGANVAIVDLTAEAVGGVTAHAIENNGCGGGLTITHARGTTAGASAESIGLLNESCSPRIVDVETYANASGTATATAVRNSNASPSLLHVTATAASQNGTAMGVYNAPGGSPTLEHVTATATGGGDCYGLLNNGGAGTRVTLRNVSASALEPIAFGYGIRNFGGNGVVVMTDVIASASGSNGVLRGMSNDSVVANLTNVTASASGGTTRYGLVNSASTVTVDRSSLEGSTNSVISQFTSTVRLGGSKLTGPAVTAADSTTSCLFSYNGAYGALNGLCQ